MRLDLLDRVASILVTLVAGLIGVTVLRRDWSDEPRERTPSLELTRLSEWDAVRQRAIWLTKQAPVEVVQFGDFQCPFCRQFAMDVESLPDSVRLLIRSGIVNFPLPSHTAARSAALEVYCASVTGAAKDVHDFLFSRQDSLALVNVRSLVSRAGLGADATRISCIESREAASVLDSSVAFGHALRVRGTPTVVIGGWRASRPPNPDELAAIVKAVANRENPNEAVRRFE